MVRGFAFATLGCCASVFLALPAHAQNGETGRGRVEVDYEAIRGTKIITALRIAEPITLDGRLEEPGWNTAERGADFFQKFPSNGAPATEPTEFRVLYDDDTLYVGVTATDSQPDRMVVKELRED